MLSSHLLITNLLPTLIALKNDMDWRVRQNLLQYIPLLSKQLGKELTYKELRPILCEWGRGEAETQLHHRLCGGHSRDGDGCLETALRVLRRRVR